MAANEEAVRQALGQVRLPDGRDLLGSGRVQSVSVNGDAAIVTIAIAPAEAKAFEPVRRAAEQAVAAVPGVAKALVALTADRAPAPPPPRAAPTGPVPIPGVRHMVAVASGKGGVGKSTTAVNLALALQGLGWRVGLLDADIYGPSVPTLTGATGKPALAGERMLQPLQAHGMPVMSIGFMVEPDAALIWRGPMVDSALTQMLREVAWGTLDCLVVDMPPGTGDAQLTMAQKAPLSGAVVVSTPQDLALIDARRGIAMFAKAGVPVLGIVENMSTFVCPACGFRCDIFGHGGAEREAERAHVPFLGAVPLHMAIRTHSDEGVPVVVADPDGPHAAAYRGIAERLKAGLEGVATHMP